MDKTEFADCPEYIAKPVGYSQFVGEIMPTPIPFIKRACNIVHANRHLEGGHFAALEHPTVIWNDVLDYLQAAGKASPKI